MLPYWEDGMPATLKLTAKGQITLKKEFLQHLGADMGSVLNVEKLPNGGLRISTAKPEKIPGSFADFAGIFNNPTGRRFSIDEINETVAEAYAEAGIQGLSK
ncbi:AbrB/MazE/SpoVT family DNA-binding domain-containing protein [Kingella oralis]|jgi:toxin-antitoxin system, antitoxin component, abrB famil|uniref:AbrB/MazE/SpoVT family DNA-binding domain-containing protein n=2 Tax=Kingella oralis TaxID=505 RepID=UPI002D7EFC72|nr:AbrB/MazE/SpoVT family DNA-binding domain-containing protein [Kingella oralis]